jgi:predicted deacylase
VRAPPGPAGLDVPRVLGDLGEPAGELMAPTLVVVSGIHGNEPAGVDASLRVISALQGREGSLRGRVVFLTGNRRALRERVRFLDRDLNRGWTPAKVASLRRLPGEGGAGVSSPEDEEQRELLEALDAILDVSAGPVWILDLHTTSGEGGIFTTVGDTLENRAMALTLPVPLVLGLEEMVEGTLQDYLGRRGVVAAVFESGQHVEPAAVHRAEAAIWMLLAAAGVCPEASLPELAPSRKRLVRDGHQLPRSLEIRYRHGIEPESLFVMEPGWANFQRVRRGEALARDRQGPVRAPAGGRILMPLYQPQGEDGFFLVREFHPFWLNLSRILRRARVDRIVHWFPGIRKDLERPDVLVVNRRVARWYALQLLHLLGFRRHHEDGAHLVVLRRPRPIRAPGR